MFLGDFFERRKFVNARVVHENIKPAERVLRFGEQAFNVRLLSHVPLHRDSFAAGLGDFTDNFIRAGFAGSVIDDDRSALRREIFGDGSADALGRPRDDGDLAAQFFCIICAHRIINFIGCVENPN